MRFKVDLMEYAIFEKLFENFPQQNTCYQKQILVINDILIGAFSHALEAFIYLPPFQLFLFQDPIQRRAQ